MPPGNNDIRAVLDRAESGAPAAGSAVRDRFSTDEIFHRIIATADEEFRRSMRLLFLSGLAAGLSISLSFVGAAALWEVAPEGYGDILSDLIYPLGFFFVVAGRYQLFTENTLTPVTLVLTRIASVPTLLKVWVVVLAANVLGAALTAYVLASTGIFSPEVAEQARYFGHHFLEMGGWDVFWKGVVAGWLVASMVWILHATDDDAARFLFIFVIIYTIALADLAHCIVGACEVLYLVFLNEATLAAALGGFFGPAVLGNTVGGVLLVAILNFAQTEEVRFPDRDCGRMKLSWKEWLLGSAVGPVQGEPVSVGDDVIDNPAAPSEPASEGVADDGVGAEDANTSEPHRQVAEQES
jgi:formate/nitrite transporter FocA (FNT family)